MIKIAITGPESSGKTSLAKDLANYYKTDWIPEYARTYLLKNGLNYSKEDLDKIAIGQVELWKNAKTKDILFYDTEMLVMKIWSEVKYKTVSETIKNLLKEQKFDFYLLCSPDIPWKEDPLRENSSNRDELFELYLKELKTNNLPFDIIKGDRLERLSNTIKIIGELNLGSRSL